MSAREFLQRNMDDGKKLEQFVDLILPFFKKMSLLNPQSLQFFNQEYSCSRRNYQEGTFSSMTLLTNFFRQILKKMTDTI